MNNDYILRSILNTQRFISHLDMVADERRVWDAEIKQIKHLLKLSNKAKAKAREANA